MDFKMNNELELNCKTSIKTEVLDYEFHEQVDETNLTYNSETGEKLHFVKLEKDEFEEESHHIEDIYIKSTNFIANSKGIIGLDETKYIVESPSENSRLQKDLETGENNYNSDCTYISERLVNQDNLKRRMLVHTKEKNFKCTICDKSFFRKKTLKDHLLEHTGERYKCDICEKSFTRSTGLSKHISLRICEKQIKNPNCHASFSSRSNLKSHMTVHIDEKNYKCDFCNQSFSKQKDLKSHHLSLHSRKKKNNLKCNSFIYNCNLKSHILAGKTGKKGFKCTFCDKSFCEKVTLYYHLYLHTGEKNHECEICEKSFALIDELNKHRQVHHIIKEEPKTDKEIKMEVLDYKSNEKGGNVDWDPNLDHKSETEEKPINVKVENKEFKKELHDIEKVFIKSENEL